MLFCLLLIFWMILNARITLEVFLFGVILSALLTRFCHSQGIWPKWLDKALIRLLPRIVKYLAVLFVSMIQSSLQVMKVILTPGLKELNPRLMFLKPDIRTEPPQVVLANSITLTPGTFTVSLLSDGVYCIHALNEDFSLGAKSLEFVPMLKEMDSYVEEAKGICADKKEGESV